MASNNSGPFVSRVRRLLIAAAVASPGLASFATLAFAQGSYPDKAIRLVMPYPAGGMSDVSARTIAQPLSKALGQPIIVENKADIKAENMKDLLALIKASPDKLAIGISPIEW